jgi:hypothetical protein
MPTDNATWNLVVAILYATLCTAAIARLAVKLACGGSDPGGLSATLVFCSLVCYSAARSVILFLVYAGYVTHMQGVTQNLYDAIPGTFFDILQTAMIAKWVGHANDISLVLRRQEFFLGPVALWISVGMTVTNVIAAVVCAAVCHKREPTDDWVWNDVLNIFSGAAYIVNGLFFCGLGVAMRSLWNPTSFVDKVASARILCMAFFFGGMCAVRGGLLIAEGTVPGNMSETASSWGAPCALTAEWVCLVVSMFILTGSKGQGRQGTPTTSVPVKSLSTRRGSFGKWFKTALTSGTRTQSSRAAPPSSTSEAQTELECTPTGTESLLNETAQVNSPEEA